MQPYIYKIKNSNCTVIKWLIPFGSQQSISDETLRLSGQLDDPQTRSLVHSIDALQWPSSTPQGSEVEPFLRN